MDDHDQKSGLRKGPWTEQEDVQLVLYVNLFGDRRWDFIAKVSGLKRTGKSCRLRWVNYLNPGLRRGKMTPHEERLVLELHKKWGNRWSKIAEKIPGRTDNEIKNYWRTQMRKMAQDQKKRSAVISPLSPSSSSSTTYSNSSSSSTSNTTKSTSFYDTGGLDSIDVVPGGSKTTLAVAESSKSTTYSLDDIWKDIEFSDECCNLTSQTMVSPTWDFCSIERLWSMDDEEEENKMLKQPMSDDHFHFSYKHMTG